MRNLHRRRVLSGLVALMVASGCGMKPENGVSARPVEETAPSQLARPSEVAPVAHSLANYDGACGGRASESRARGGGPF